MFGSSYHVNGLAACEERATFLGLYFESDGPFYPQVRRDCLDDLSHTGCAHGKDRLGEFLLW